MPYYEYECPEQHIWTAWASVDTRDIGYCPECGTTAIRRLFGVVGIHFKGTGWGKDKK